MQKNSHFIAEKWEKAKEEWICNACQIIEKDKNEVILMNLSMFYRHYELAEFILVSCIMDIFC